MQEILIFGNMNTQYTFQLRASFSKKNWALKLFLLQIRNMVRFASHLVAVKQQCNFLCNTCFSAFHDVPFFLVQSLADGDRLKVRRVRDWIFFTNVTTRQLDLMKRKGVTLDSFKISFQLEKFVLPEERFDGDEI